MNHSNNTGRVVRAKRKNQFTHIQNSILQDSEMSWKAKGLLAYLLSLPDDWILHKSEVKKHATDGKDSTRSAWDELEGKGFIVSTEVREGGKFKGFNYVVHEEPILTDGGKSDIGFSDVGFSDIGKPATTKKHSTKRNYVTTKDTKRDTPAESSKSESQNTEEASTPQSPPPPRKGFEAPSKEEFLSYAKEKAEQYNLQLDVTKVLLKYDSWAGENWVNGKGKKILNWKSTLNNTLPYLQIEKGFSKSNLKTVHSRQGSSINDHLSQAERLKQSGVI